MEDAVALIGWARALRGARVRAAAPSKLLTVALRVCQSEMTVRATTPICPGPGSRAARSLATDYASVPATVARVPDLERLGVAVLPRCDSGGLRLPFGPLIASSSVEVERPTRREPRRCARQIYFPCIPPTGQRAGPPPALATLRSASSATAGGSTRPHTAMPATGRWGFDESRSLRPSRSHCPMQSGRPTGMGGASDQGTSGDPRRSLAGDPIVWGPVPALGSTPQAVRCGRAAAVVSARCPDRSSLSRDSSATGPRAPVVAGGDRRDESTTAVFDRHQGGFGRSCRLANRKARWAASSQAGDRGRQERTDSAHSHPLAIFPMDNHHV